MFEVGKALRRSKAALDASLPNFSRAAFSRHDALDHAPDHDADNAHALGLAPAPESEAPSTLRLAILSTILAIFVAFYAFSVSAPGRRVMANVLPEPAIVARALGIGIDEVALTGHRYTFDGDVFDALDLGNVRTFARLDVGAAKTRIERLPWVATAEITRVYPNRLDVRVTERRPFALWSRGGTAYLIDDTGRVLGPAAEISSATLPRISGEGANERARELIDLLAHYPKIRDRYDEAERVAGRRWNLKLANGVILKLPVDGEAQILSRLTDDHALAALAEKPNTSLDFRARGRVAVSPATSGKPAEPKDAGS